MTAAADADMTVGPRPINDVALGISEGLNFIPAGHCSMSYSSSGLIPSCAESRAASAILGRQGKGQRQTRSEKN